MSMITIIILGIIAFTKASSDGSDKYIASVDAYQQTNTGQVPQFKDYEGTTDLSTCITICGCKSYPVAAFDNGTNSCYCGEKLTDPCKTDTCISIYNSDGFTISFASTTPSNVYVNEPFDVAAQSSDNVEKFGLLINERLAVYPSKLMPSVKIGMPGNYSMVVEANAFYGCPSEVQNFVVEVGSTSCSFITPSQFKSRVNTTFNMFLDLTGPDDLPLLIIRLFNGSTDNQIAEYSYTDPSASTYVEIGGNSETNRYQTYNLTFSENKRTAVIVSLNHLISSSGIVTGFSAHITKPGGIRFLILEPACELTTSGSARKMCYLSKKCVASSDTCPQYFNTFYPSAATDIFYPDWIQFGPSNTNLPTNLVPRAASDIMFRVVYSFSVNTTVLGHNDFDVPDSEQFSTSPGQFLAWMPDYSNSTPGDIAYNSIDSASQFQSIHYDEIFDVFFNETFDDNSAYLSPITISKTEHMISLYLEIPSTYLVEVSADNPDGTDFIAQAFVKDSDNNEKLICEGITSIVTDIRNLTLSTSDLSTSVLTDTVVVFNVSGFGIAKANYAVYWDEDIVKKTGVYDEIFNSSEFEHSFSKPGSYNVTVKAFTELSFKITNFTLNVICGLSTPSFFNTNEDPIKANEEINPVKKTDTEISIDVAFTGCGMITINYYLESDILQTNGSSFLWLSDSSIFVIRSNEFQTQAQNINVTVCATNNIEVHCLNDIGYVEEVIENFNLIVTTMETNVSGLLNISSKTKGTNKTYCIEWGDGNSTCTNGTYNVESIEHTYTRPGNYTIFALAFNRVSRMNLTVQQEVQDRISGCKISANPTIFKEITYVTLGIENGTGISLVLDWGNGRKNLINNFDISFNDSTSFPSSLLGFKGFASFKYLVKHDYNICLSLTNDISNDSCCVVAIVEDEIMELNISLAQEFQGTNKTDWIEENETLSLTSEHSIMAGRIVYLVNLGNETVFNTTNSVVNVSYTPWKLCYNYSVVATNPVSIASDWMNLCVQRPLYPINSTGFVHAPENSTEEMSIKFTFSSGNYFDCYFNFSDESENSISQVSYTDFVGPIGFIETKHKFKAGEYNVTLSCTNRLYDFFSSTVVLSQNPINKPYLEISALCYNDSIVSEVQLTTDPPGVMSAACNIYVKIDEQSGSSVNESGFLIINGKNKGSFFADNHTIEFKSKLWSGASVYSTDVCINTTNKVSTDLTCKSIKMVAPVLSVQVTVESGRHSVGVPIQFTANFPTPIPGDLCLEIDFNDNTPSQLYGGTNCKNALGLLKIPFILSYQYKKVGIYSVTFKASNQISSVTETTLIRVLDAPCSAPYIEITSSAANSEDALNDNQKAYFFKCKNTTFKHIMRRNCSRDFATLTKNIVLEYKVNNDTWLKVVDESLDKQYILVRKTLERYGVYRLTYIGQMVDNRSLELIDDTTSKKIGYFKIVPCPLRIVVDGGYEKTFQRGGEIIIDATQSYDPDDDKASIKADWFCGRSDAFEGVDVNSITEKISYPVVDLSKYTEEMFPSKGCFSNSESAALLNDKGLMSLKLVLISDYLWHFCYDLRLRIMKINDEFKRQSIRDITICLKSNDSFLVSVKCEQNCDDLVNPNSKLSLSSLVLNKGNGTQITYNWQVFRMLQGDISSTYEDITDELRAANKSTTGFDKRNFVLLPNSLNSTYRYKFRVNASCNSCEKLSGAGAEIKDVNSPPDVSKATCKISPPTGVAAQTDFIITCFGVEDEQLPLFYGFEFNCNDTWALLTISTSVSNVTSGKFKLPVGHNTFSTDANYCFLRVKVRDSYGVSSDYTPTLYVQVSDGSNSKRKKRSDEDLSIKMCYDLSTDYVLSSQSLTASYISILSEMKSSLSEKCKNSIEEKLVSIWVDTPDDANFVVHNILTDGNHTIALNALQNIVNTISILSATELTEISNHILSKTSLLGGKSTMEFALTLESKLCSAIALTLIIGEPAAKSSNPQSTISIEQIEPGPKVIGGFDLPDIGGEGGGAINSIGANRYSFDKASSNVKGPVKGLSLTNPDGSPKSVKNLPKPILLTLENTEKKIPMKNFTAYCELMRDIHRVDATVNSSIIVLNILPMDENFTGSFFLFMNKGTAPSLTDNQQNCTLPNLPPSDWDSLPQASQEYWEREKKWNCYFSEIELNRTAVGVWCVGVIYYNDSHPLAKALLPLSAAPSDDNCTAVRYYFQAYTRACLYWDKDIGTWNTDGCDTVENETNSYQTVCGCTHLTDFGGGGPIATAEPLDLGNLRKFDLKSNPTVFAVVMALFGVYLILLVWARKKDIRDFEKNKVIVLPENHHEDKYLYEIVVETGFKQECSTTADVMIVITGRNGESGPRRLYSPYRKCFQKAETDFFIMAVPACLGELSDITIWHNNAGVSPGWFLLKVQVRDMQTQKKVEFLCNQWFDVAEDDGMIIRTLQPSTHEEITEFKYLFFVTLRRNLYEGHIWLSLFTRPAQSSFTTCQRLATCMSLLMTSMIANAMFYKGDTGPPATSITMGPFTFSVNEVKTAFTVALIVVPTNLLIILLFKKAGPKIPKNSTKYELQEKEVNVVVASPVEQEMLNVKKYNSWVKFFRSILFPGGEDEEVDNKKPLPYWLIYIAYMLAFISSVVSAFFVIAYGFQFGKTKSDQWIVSMLFSFCYSVFLIQPFKVVVLSLIFSALLKVPSSNGRASSIINGRLKPLSEEEEEIEMTKVINKDSNKFSLPDERKLNEFRVARMKEKRIKIIIKEVLVHLSFVILVIVVAYSSADPSCFDLYNSVHQLCASNGILKDYVNGKITVDGEETDIPSGYDVATNEDWFTWTTNSVVGYLFPKGWYSDIPMDFPHGFVADSASSKVLAMARFRQLRVMRNSCTKHPVFKYLISECNAGYSYSSEEVEEYKAGWQPPLNQTERFRRRRGKRKALWKGLEDPWLYQTTSQLKNPFPFTGLFNTYTGSSYAVSIGPDRRTANRILKDLKQNFWVDRYTRALFTEINIYNANTNLLLIVTFLHEVLPTGGWNFYTNVQALRLYRYVGGLGDLVIVFDIVFSAISFIGVFKSVRAIRKSSLKEYLSNPWNLLHVVVTVNSICAIAFTLGRMLAVNAAVAEYTAEPEMFVSFQFVGQLEYLIIGCLGFVLFFTNLEFLRILRFNRLIALLSKSISIMSGPLLSFGLIFFVVFMAFVSFTTCIYVDKLEDFQSVPRSFVTMTTMFLGKISVSDYFNNAPVFGPLMFASYMLSIQMIMINLFVGLICDAFAEVSEQEAPDEEPSVFGFMIDRVKNINSGGGAPDPIYSEWKDDWEQMIDNLKSGCDNCTYLMRNMEAEELRQNKFFDQGDKIKRELLVAVLGLDFFTSEVEFCDGLTSLEKKLLNITPEDAKHFLLQAAVKRRIALQQELLDQHENGED